MEGSPENDVSSLIADCILHYSPSFPHITTGSTLSTLLRFKFSQIKQIKSMSSMEKSTAKSLRLELE